MSTILEALPSQEQKKQLFAEVSQLFNPQQLGLTLLQNLDISDLIATFPTTVGRSFSLDALPAVPENMLAQIQQPLAQIAAIQGSWQLDMGGDNPFAALTKPTFPIEEIVTPITANLLPLFTGTQPTLGQEPFTALFLDYAGLKPLLAELAQTAEMTPQQVLEASLQVVDSALNRLSSTDNLVQFTTQAIPAFYLEQITCLDACLPFVALENALACWQTPKQTLTFSERYQDLLDMLGKAGAPDSAQIDAWTETGALLAPTLQTLAAAGQTLAWLGANDMQAITTTITRLLKLSGNDEIFLQPLFDQCAQLVNQILDAVGAPLRELGERVQPMRDYLDQAITTAKTAVEQVAKTLTAALEKIPQILDTCCAALERVATQLHEFIAKLNIGSLIEQVKSDIAQLATGLDDGLTQLEDVKQQLDQGIAHFQTNVDGEVATALQRLATEIRALLATINALLTRDDLQAVLTQAHQALEKFRLVLEQIALKPVFDLVLTQTRAMESSINAIDAARLGVPQRSALKIGVQLLKEVKVDEQIKPELLAAFAQVRTPLAELLAFLQAKILLLEQTIDQFNPGTLVQELLETTVPYQQLIATLDEFRPSQQLAPLQELSQTVTTLLEHLNPNQLIDQIEKLYAELTPLLDTLNPAQFASLLKDAIATPITHLSEEGLAQIFQMIQNHIAFDQLLAGTGLASSETAPSWSLLIKQLDGASLDLVAKAIAATEEELATATFNMPAPVVSLERLLVNINSQLAMTPATIGNQLRLLQGQLAAADWEAWQARRQELLAHHAATPAIQQLLQALDLAPVLELQGTVAALLTDSSALNSGLERLTSALQGAPEALQALSASTLNTLAPAIFRQQVGAPLRQLIAQIQTQLAPLAMAVESLQMLTAAVAALPAQLAAFVTDFLATIQTRLTTLLTEGINTVQTAGNTMIQMLQTVYERLQRTITQFSPIWLLNAFDLSDFIDDRPGKAEIPLGLVRMAFLIAQGQGDLSWPARLQAKLTTSELATLQRAVSSTPLPQTLPADVCAFVYQALNGVLTDGEVLPASEVQAIKQHLQTQLDAAMASAAESLESGSEQLIATKRRYRLQALQDQITTGETVYQQSQRPHDLLRFKRVLLEASYPDNIAMSLQSLQPTLVAQAAQLYPTAALQRLDAIYVELVDKVKQLPDELIRAPLDEAFHAIKELFQANFDLAGLFAVLSRKLDGVDQDLATGLARLSVAYQRLLVTFDQRLAG